MSLSKSRNTTLLTYWKLSMGWTSVDKWADLPPSGDALKIRFLFCRETQHALGTCEDVCEGYEISRTEKVITIRPSQLCSEHTSSIKQSHSIRMIEDFINTEFPPSKRESKRSVIVDRIIELVQNPIWSPMAPNHVIDVRLSNGLMIVHDTSDKKGLLDYVEATRRGICVICMDDFEVGSDASRLPCLHIFHGTCVVNWLLRNHNCPSCRQSIPPNLRTWF